MKIKSTRKVICGVFLAIFMVGCVLSIEVAENSTLIQEISTNNSPNAAAVVFSDSFESGTGKWTYNGLWHLSGGSAWPNPYRSPSNAMWYGQETTGYYNTGSSNSGTLTSIAFDLSMYSSASLEFYHWLETESGETYDTCKVYISSDGSTYNQIYTRGSTGYITPWQQQLIDISEYCGYSSVRIRFEFNTVDGYSNDYRGWLIDDISVTASGSVEVGASETEPNNSFSTANLITEGPIEGGLSPSDFEDYFKIELKSGDTFTLDVTGFGTGNQVDAYFLDSSYAILQTDTDGIELDITYKVSSSGIYYIKFVNVEGGYGKYSGQISVTAETTTTKRSNSFDFDLDDYLIYIIIGAGCFGVVGVVAVVKSKKKGKSLDDAYPLRSATPAYASSDGSGGFYVYGQNQAPPSPLLSEPAFGAVNDNPSFQPTPIQSKPASSRLKEITPIETFELESEQASEGWINDKDDTLVDLLGDSTEPSFSPDIQKIESINAMPPPKPIESAFYKPVAPKPLNVISTERPLKPRMPVDIRKYPVMKFDQLDAFWLPKTGGEIQTFWMPSNETPIAAWMPDANYPIASWMPSAPTPIGFWMPWAPAVDAFWKPNQSTIHTFWKP